MNDRRTFLVRYHTDIILLFLQIGKNENNIQAVKEEAEEEKKKRKKCV